MGRTSWFFRWLDSLKHPHFYMLLLFLALLITRPLLPAPVLTLVLIGTLTLSALLLRGGRRLNRVVMLLCGLPFLVFGMVNLIRPSLMHEVAGPSALWYVAIAGLIFIIYSTFVIGRALLATRRITADVIVAAINLYIIIGITWAFVYFLLHDANSGAFNLPPIPNNPELESQSFTTFIYYSFVTQATQGYGDISPQLPLARMLVVVHTMVGQFYVVLVMAYLVSVSISQREQASIEQSMAGAERNRPGEGQSSGP